MPLNKTAFSCMSWWFSGYIKMMWVIEMWDQTLPMLFFLVPMMKLWMSHVWSIHLSKITFRIFELFNLLGISCTHVFFKWKSLPLHDERRQMESHLWFCGRVMSYSQNYWGSNLVDCIFFLMRQGKIEWGLSLKGEEMESELVSWKRSNIRMY